MVIETIIIDIKKYLKIEIIRYYEQEINVEMEKEKCNMVQVSKTLESKKTKILISQKYNNYM